MEKIDRATVKKEIWNPGGNEGRQVNDYTQPPCTSCGFWMPERKLRWVDEGYQEYDGVRFCHAEKMYHDFSCFEPKPELYEEEKKYA